MLACPGCTGRLVRAQTKEGMVYDCPVCGSRGVGFSALSRAADPKFMRRIMQAAYSGRSRPGPSCPHCHQNMRPVIVGPPPTPDSQPLRVHVCTPCRYVWFDRRASLAAAQPPPEPTPEPPLLPEKARRALEAAYGSDDSGEAEHPPVAVGLPDAGWQYIPAILGLPVEYNVAPLVRKPYVTWGLSLAMAIVFFNEIVSGTLSAAVRDWGFIPQYWLRNNGLTILTSFFLHGGVFHILSNLYFFIIFGDNVEDDLGPRRFLLLLLAGHVVGIAAHAALDPNGTIPLVGASAGISGVISYYALRYPQARVGVFLRIIYVRLNVMWALVLYVGLQVIGAWLQTQGQIGVSSLAHLGGLAVGLLAGMWRRIR